MKHLLKKLNITIDAAINLEVPTEVILDRLTTRRTCSNSSCQEIYNVKSKPPTEDGKCKKCGSPVVQRDDETDEAIKKRLDTYNEKTAPLIDFYKNEGILLNVSATSSDVVFKAIKEAIKK